jgi:hypothetical protein
MKTWKPALCLFLTTRLAAAETTLTFGADVRNEGLAEDAIELAHCLSERSGHPWEFTGETRGPLWLKVHEENGRLRGVYHKEGKDLAFEARPGSTDETCEKLEPSNRPGPVAASLAPPPEVREATRLGALTEEPAPTAPSTRTWIWAGAAVAIVGGILFWRSRQPAYRTVDMR